ncbi:hypothetical protein Q4511_09920 [Paracoccus sp. 1_MG-2023]|uniref:hypothetical protein n=1 Tax=unclassified Paracoccus (in: a-proteobacteria) TaxID=2688777 RepID=UPI001C08559F|nr:MULTISPECIES: hypothetical protein [unclassified Paracoccus (in: a-proteobacteria)]MBU2956720.1 hypothetical protein [Paracoccus sp. C2R09]MDO6669240.1 hypothetical protein [Paracoccus sp. 1_MG-2023]
MPAQRADRTERTAPKAPRRPAVSEQQVIRPDPKVKSPVASRANEIVRAIGLRPITGLSGPKIGY